MQSDAARRWITQTSKLMDVTEWFVMMFPPANTSIDANINMYRWKPCFGYAAELPALAHKSVVCCFLPSANGVYDQ